MEPVRGRVRNDGVGATPGGRYARHTEPATDPRRTPPYKVARGFRVAGRPRATDAHRTGSIREQAQLDRLTGWLENSFEVQSAHAHIVRNGPSPQRHRQR